jgi:hypothetical protein
MATVFLVHWNEAEAKGMAEPLRAAGNEVRLHWRTDASAPLKDALPDVVVISLERLPSHGRAIAEWLWEAKKRQHIPVVFAGGLPEKVEATRMKFPQAVFCTPAALVRTVSRLAGRRLE